MEAKKRKQRRALAARKSEQERIRHEAHTLQQIAKREAAQEPQPAAAEEAWAYLDDDEAVATHMFGAISGLEGGDGPAESRHWQSMVYTPPTPPRVVRSPQAREPLDAPSESE